MTPDYDPNAPLPLWRTISGFAVFGILAGVLLLLAPAYVANYRFSVRVKSVVNANAKADEEGLRTALLAEAKASGMPVFPGDIRILHPGSKPEVEMKYIVQKGLGPYHVDLHFRPSAKVK